MDRSPDGLVCVVAAYRDFDKGTTHVEPVFVRDGATTMRETVRWLLNTTTPRRVPIVLDAKSPASTAISELSRRNLVITHTDELVRSAISFTDDMVAGLVSHADTGNGDLARAVAGARRRPGTAARVLPAGDQQTGQIRDRSPVTQDDVSAK